MSNEEKQDEHGTLLDHDADGIQEFDNDLPRWWLYGFYFTIACSVVYMYYYHVHSGNDWNFLWYNARGQHQEYAAEIAEAKALLANAPKKEAMAMVLLTDQASLDAGKEIFNGTNSLCFTCHREDLGGLVGPNLTDDYWVHGCSIQDIVKNIVSGFPEKGMLPYGSSNRLSDKELLQVASYIISKRGSNPPDPKPIEEGREVLCTSSEVQAQ